MEEVKSRRHTLTDEEVEQQIALLRDDPDVRLAQKATRVAYRRPRQGLHLHRTQPKRKLKRVPFSA